jgi:hypothetical protein
MKYIQEFKNLSTNNLTETEKILIRSNLVVGDSISKLALMGSKGLLGGFRTDSDIDLGFILRPDIEPNEDICRQANELSISKL